MATRLADPKPSPASFPTTPTALATPSNTSDTPSSLPGARFTRLPLAQLARADFPMVKKWDLEEYTSIRKLGKNGNEEDFKGERPTGPILSCYMEDENGNDVLKSKKNAARSTARGFFNLLLTMGRAPAVWGSADIDVQNELVHILESDFPFFRLCEDHWKAKRVATNSYSQWYPGALKRLAAAVAKQTADVEVIDVDDDSDSKDRQPKRPRVEDDKTRRSKRPRVEGTQLTPPDSGPAKITTQRRRVRIPVLCRLYMSLMTLPRICCTNPPAVCMADVSR
jgi:hypothetical protein